MSDRDYWRDTAGRPSGFWALYPATKAILIGIVSIHVLMAFVRSADRPLAYAIEDFLALSPEHVLKGFRVWQLVTCALLHGGVWHMVVNCIGIFFFGRLVEQRLGARRYLRFLLAAQLTASLGFLFLASLQDTRLPMIGASGIDFGLIVLSAFWYPGLQVMFLFVLTTPLWVLAAIYVFVEVMMLLEGGGGVAHAAHLGGALYGFFYYRWVGEFDQLFAFVGNWQARRRRRRLEYDRRSREALRGEVDRILDKVNREGMTALTEEEKRVLKEASARLRR